MVYLEEKGKNRGRRRNKYAFAGIWRDVPGVYFTFIARERERALDRYRLVSRLFQAEHFARGEAIKRGRVYKRGRKRLYFFNADGARRGRKNLRTAYRAVGIFRGTRRGRIRSRQGRVSDRTRDQRRIFCRN